MIELSIVVVQPRLVRYKTSTNFAENMTSPSSLFLSQHHDNIALRNPICAPRIHVIIKIKKCQMKKQNNDFNGGKIILF